MTLHRYARTSPNSRRLIADRVLGGGWTLAAAAEAAGVSVPTARKWVRRFREQGDAGLGDRSSAPKRIPHRTPPERERAILSLRALRLTGEQIAAALGMAPSTVSLVLKRNGQGRLPRPWASEPERRYQRSRAGELVHVDIKKLGRIARPGHRVTGSRRERGLPSRALRAGLGIRPCLRRRRHPARLRRGPRGRAPRDAASASSSARSPTSPARHPGRAGDDRQRQPAIAPRPHALACQRLGVRHLRTEPYTPRTNGKAERFIQTLINGWAYGAIYGSSAERTAALLPGSTPTTTTGRTDRSAANPPQPASPNYTTRLGLTASRRAHPRPRE